MTKPLKLTDLRQCTLDASLIISQLPGDLRQLAYPLILRELLDNEYEDDL